MTVVRAPYGSLSSDQAFDIAGDGSPRVSENVDVTDLERAEQEIIFANERLRLAMESAKAVGWEWDLVSDRETWFGDLRTMFGIPSKTYIGSSRRLVLPEDQGLISNALDAAMHSHQPYAAEFRVRREDGTVRWVAANGRFYYGSNSEPERMLGMAVDITERKRAEESLRRKEMDLTEAQRVARVGSWQWDSENDTVVWSEELYRIAGRDPNLGTINYKEHGQLYTPKSWELLQRAVGEALHHGTPYELELEMVRTDGSTRWLTARGEASRDTNGRIVGLRGTVQDIAERKRREESLVLFRSLIDGSNDALEVIDPTTLCFLDVNEKACRDLGYSRDELLSMTVLDIDPSLDEAMRTAFARQCREAGFVMFESQHRRKDGSTFPVEVSIKSIAVGGRSYNVCVVRDIIERRVAQQALRESEERLRLAAEAGRMFAYTWDVPSDVIVRSGKSEQIIGIAESVPLTCEQIFAFVHPDDRDGLKAVVAELSPEKPLLQASYRMIRPDGSVIWVERHSRAYFDDDGRMLRTVGMVADITQRKLAEEALSSVSRRLIEAQEGERARIARELHDDIGQRLAILAVTLDEIKLLTTKSRGELGSGIDALQRQTSEISSAIHSLSHELHSSKLELLGAVVAMRGFCAELSGQQKVEVDFSHKDVPQRVPPEIALCLFRVMQEALHNAVRHSGVRQFAVQLEGTSHALRLTVRDEGVGFDAGTTASRGLGLTSMKERLKLVGGTLSIQSQLKQGSTIVASVPFQARAN